MALGVTGLVSGGLGVGVCGGSGGGGKGDVVAECFELVDVSAAGAVGRALVPAGSEFAIALGGVGEQVPVALWGPSLRAGRAADFG